MLKSTDTPNRLQSRRDRVRGRLYYGLEQLTYRSLTNMTPSGITHFIHDRQGNVIAETDGTGPAGTVKEYIWLPALRSSRAPSRGVNRQRQQDAEIAPTAGSRTVVDRPIAVVNAVNTAPVIWQVHVDHLNRPIRMTDAAKASVWDVVWSPWGSAWSLSGAATLDARFPGQWYQLESGLHYNWHRHYDPSLGRYTQPDPLGFVDGPSVYGYAVGSPQVYVDQEGRAVPVLIQIVATYCGANPGACAAAAAATAEAIKNICMMATPGNVADTQIVNDWAAAGGPPDKCKWLAENAHRYRPDQVKRTQKAWGCGRSRANRE